MHFRFPAVPFGITHTAIIKKHVNFSPLCHFEFEPIGATLLFILNEMKENRSIKHISITKALDILICEIL